MPERGRVAARLGLTDGQVSTLALGVALGVASLAIGLPPVLRQTDQIVGAEPSVPPALTLGAAEQEVVETFAVFTAATPAATVTTTPPPPTVLVSTSTTTAARPPADAAPAIDALVVVENGWARSRGITDLFPATIDDGELPVGSTLGREDYRSFVRLDGEGSELRLSVIDDHPDNRSAEAASIQACANTTDTWAAGGDQAMGDAPNPDPARCVEGVRDDNEFRFDLSGLAVEPAAGLSLLGGGTQAGASFTVVLRPPT